VDRFFAKSGAATMMPAELSTRIMLDMIHLQSGATVPPQRD